MRVELLDVMRVERIGCPCSRQEQRLSKADKKVLAELFRQPRNEPTNFKDQFL
jgi:hypothetical protein